MYSPTPTRTHAWLYRARAHTHAPAPTFSFCIPKPQFNGTRTQKAHIVTQTDQHHCQHIHGQFFLGRLEKTRKRKREKKKKQKHGSQTHITGRLHPPPPASPTQPHQPLTHHDNRTSFDPTRPRLPLPTTPTRERAPHTCIASSCSSSDPRSAPPPPPPSI